MKKDKKTTVYFNIKLPVGILLACIGVAALGLAGCVLSIWRLINFGAGTPWDIVKYAVLIPVCVFCIVIALSVVFYSKYTITNAWLVQTFGLFHERFIIKEIRSVLLNSETHKLTVYTETQTIAVFITPNENERFVRALTNINPDIEYGFTLADKPDEQ